MLQTKLGLCKPNQIPYVFENNSPVGYPSLLFSYIAFAANCLSDGHMEGWDAGSGYARQ